MAWLKAKPTEFKSPQAPKLYAEIDPFVKSSKVLGLDPESYRPFVHSKDAALIMFYNPLLKECNTSAKHFAKAAKKSKFPTHGFAAVDCSQNSKLCCEEKIGVLPYFRLYAFGKPLSNFYYSNQYQYHDMKTWMKGVPSVDPKIGTPAMKESPIYTELDRESHIYDEVPFEGDDCSICRAETPKGAPCAERVCETPVDEVPPELKDKQTPRRISFGLEGAITTPDEGSIYGGPKADAIRTPESKCEEIMSSIISSADVEWGTGTPPEGSIYGVQIADVPYKVPTPEVRYKESMARRIIPPGVQWDASEGSIYGAQMAEEPFKIQTPRVDYRQRDTSRRSSAALDWESGISRDESVYERDVTNVPCKIQTPVSYNETMSPIIASADFDWETRTSHVESFHDRQAADVTCKIQTPEASYNKSLSPILGSADSEWEAISTGVGGIYERQMARVPYRIPTPKYSESVSHRFSSVDSDWETGTPRAESFYESQKADMACKIPTPGVSYRDNVSRKISFADSDWETGTQRTDSFYDRQISDITCKSDTPEVKEHERCIIEESPVRYVPRSVKELIDYYEKVLPFRGDPGRYYEESARQNVDNNDIYYGGASAQQQ